MRDLNSVPELPKKPHDFHSLARKSVAVQLPGRAQPVSISYVEAGTGEPLLLVHGLMHSAYTWRYVLSKLSTNYRVIALDLPGGGASEAPENLSQRPGELASAIAAFIDAVGWVRPYLVANSMGGYLALWTSILHPGKIGRLLVTHAPGIPEARLYLLHAILSMPGARSLFRFYARKPEQFALDNVHYRDESLKSREELREDSRWTADANSREIFFRHLWQTMSPYEMQKLPAAVAAARAAGTLPPIRFVYSDWDPLVPPEFGKRYQAIFPEAELIWLKDASHFTHVDAPEETIREILRFGARA